MLSFFGLITWKESTPPANTGTKTSVCFPTALPIATPPQKYFDLHKLFIKDSSSDEDYYLFFCCKSMLEK